MTIAQIKALFQTGKIPTQADFENLISKIPNNDSMKGDNTLDLTNPSNPNVLGYRFVTIGDECSYIFIGLYDATQAAYIPYIIVHCNTGSPSEYGNTPPVNYTILTSELMAAMYNVLGDMHSATDDAIVSAIPAQAEWCTIGYNMLSITHRIVKNLLSEEHFFKTIDGNDQIYLRVVYSDLNHSMPIITNAIRISFYNNGTYTIYNYILKTISSITDFNTYKSGLKYIMLSKDIQLNDMLNFIDTYMKNINLTN